MSQPIPFLSPRMVGDRFDEHSIPLEMLKDLAVLEEMIIEIAKWCYLKEHPDRKRSPKGFTDGISIKLTGVGEGSAIPQLNLFVENVQSSLGENQQYFELARDHLIGAINAAEHDELITQHLPDSLLGYFDRIGRGLREGEVIEFAPNDISRKAKLTKATRRKLVLASSSVQELTEEVTLRGSVPEADQAKMTFEIQVINGPRVLAPIAGQHLQTVIDAFNGFQQGLRVFLKGIGRFDRYDRLQSLDVIEHLGLLDVKDVATRLEELKALRNGWLDGNRKSIAPSESLMKWLTVHFDNNYPEDLPLPYLYPTTEGGIQAEWSLGDHEITLEISDNLSSEWHVLNIKIEEEKTKTLQLSQVSDWKWLIDEIGKLTIGTA